MTPSNKRIGIFLPKLSPYGGVENFGRRFSEVLAKDGFDVDFVCARAEHPLPEGVNVIRVGRGGPFKVLKMAWFALRCEKIRRKRQYDLTMGLGKTFHQDILRMGGGPLPVFWRLTREGYPRGMSRWWKMLRRRLAPSNWLTRLIDRRQARSAKYIIAVSHKVRDWLIQTYPWLDETKIRIIYNQPDPQQYFPAGPDEKAGLRKSLGISPHQTLLVTAGTNFQIKGLSPLVTALAMLPDNFVLLVAGGRNPAGYRKRAERLGVNDRVRFLGRVDKMADLYRAADLFVLPTFYDACSNAVMEALFCGCKTLSSVHNGSSYFLPLRWVIQDPGDTKEIADKILGTAKEEDPPAFTWPEHVEYGMDSYVKFIRSLLQ